MSVGRRRFFASVSAGSAAYLTGCGTPTMSPITTDGGVGCPTVIDHDPPSLDYPASSYFDQLSMDLEAAVRASRSTAAAGPRTSRTRA